MASLARIAAALLLAAALGLRPHALRAQDPVGQAGESYPYVGAEYSYANFRGDIAAWHLLALSAGRRGPSNSFAARLNLARRFDTNGAQIEADAYPALGERSYAYLNLGYSGASIFPEWRWGAELYRNLPRAWEASLGFRQLRFAGAPVNLFTGSVGKYQGAYWFSLRPYVRYQDSGWSASASLTARRYYEDSDNYVGGRVGYGSTPSDRVTAVELARLSSTTLVAEWSRRVANRVIGSVSLTYEREEIATDRLRNRWEVSTGVRIRP